MNNILIMSHCYDVVLIVITDLVYFCIVQYIVLDVYIAEQVVS